MVYDRGGRSHSSPGFSYSGNNYHREPTPEEKEQERVKKEQQRQQQQLEQTALQSTLEMSDSAEELVDGKVVNEQQVWQEFLHLASKKYGSKVASRVASTVSDGKVSIGNLVEKEVPKDVAVEIYQDWDSLWQESASSVVAEPEAQINQVFQAGIPTAIVDTYGTTLGTKVIWRAFGAVIAKRFGAVAVQALGLSAADGLLPVGEAIAFGLLAATAIKIAKNWDELWRDAEKILVQQEPEPQIYTTPTGEQTETPRHTGHAPPEVETGTPGFDTQSGTKIPNHTGHDATETPAVEYVFESETFDRDKIPGIHIPFREYNTEYPPNWGLIEAAKNTNFSDTQYDCSEIAEDLLNAAKGEGRIIEVTPTTGNLKLREFGLTTDDIFDYHQVYTDGRYVYDPRLDENKAIPRGDWEKLMRGLNPNAIFKYLN